MVLGLLSTSLLAIACFIGTVIMGLLMPGRFAVSQHILMGFFATFLVTLAQSMTMFYFIGTGKHVKDVVAKDFVSNPALGHAFIQRTKDFKNKVFPSAMWAMMVTMATMIVGGGVHTRMFPSWIHWGLAIIAMFYNCKATWLDAKYMIEHDLLIREMDQALQGMPPVA